NFLWGFPEETDEMYSPLKSLIPQIGHLPPPSQLSRIQMRRYNYYFENAQKLNLTLSPIPIYSYIYDLEDADLTGMSYCFNPHTLKDSFDHPEFDEFEGRPNIQAADILLEQWRASFWSEHTPVLSMNDTGEYIEIKDTRECAVNSSCRLSGLHRLVYLLAETAPREEETQQLLNERFNTAHDKQEIDSVIKELCDKKLLLKLDKRLISLAVQGDLPPIPSLKEYPGGSI
ncbi:MAG: hypothetical protein GY751_04035, partial [Bacteroidetes bacterium]|nr:hypothetical protein [Bacteroidota bacterium]